MARGSAPPPDRGEFAERVRLQLAARYPGADVDIDPSRYSLRVRAPGVDTNLALTPLYNSVSREPARTPALIAQYVAGVERQMSPHSGAELSPRRVLWCVRSQTYLAGLSRSDELLTREVGADLVAFVAEDLPGSIMRGVPAGEMARAGLGEDSLRAAADENTAARFATLPDRIRALERVPADGWRMAGDPLYQSSVLTVVPVLQALTARSGGEVLVAAPDRGVVLAIPAAAAGAERFARRVTREWREAMNPCSHRVLITDGSGLREMPRRASRGGAVVLPWLGE